MHTLKATLMCVFTRAREVGVATASVRRAEENLRVGGPLP